MLKWTKELKSRIKAIKYLQENAGVNFNDLDLRKGFLDMQQEHTQQKREQVTEGQVRSVSHWNPFLSRQGYFLVACKGTVAFCRLAQKYPRLLRGLFPATGGDFPPLS